MFANVGAVQLGLATVELWVGTGSVDCVGRVWLGWAAGGLGVGLVARKM